MSPGARWRLLALPLLLSAGSAFAAEDPAIPIFRRAEAALSSRDAVALDRARGEIESLLESQPNSALAHYTRAWILSKAGRAPEALAEYDTALRLDPQLADAAYNAGVLLMGLGREPEAIARFEAAVAVDASYTDAHYNLGQAYYNRKDFAKALAAWQRTLALAPTDFQAAKKIVQAYHGMGDREGAAGARAQAIAIWRSSSDPGVRGLKEFVFDQFEASGWHVYASEVFERPEALGYLYQFKLADKNDRVVGVVRIEPRMGDAAKHGYVLGLEKGGRLWSPGPVWERLPGYDELKPAVLAAIAKEFPATP